ncbi:MAG: hypothetical protein WBZ29_03870 [Methanocella sp.]
MIRSIRIATIAIAAVVFAIALGGCTGQPPSVNNTTVVPAAVTQRMATPVPAQYQGPGDMIYGHVNLNNTPVENAQVEAVSANGTYSVRNTTDSNGTYFLYLPKDEQFNVTASYSWMRHTLWPVFANEVYDINLYQTQKTMITGKGRVIGGPLGYNISLYNFSIVMIEAIPANGNGTISAAANVDGSYSLEIMPGVSYHLKGGILTNIWFNYHNTERGGQSIDIKMGPDETALIDYVVLLP